MSLIEPYRLKTTENITPKHDTTQFSTFFKHFHFYCQLKTRFKGSVLGLTLAISLNAHRSKQIFSTLLSPCYYSCQDAS